MKQLFLSVALAAITLTLSAQVTVYKVESKGSNEAYVVPENIRADFVTNNPNAAAVTWAPINGMWQATYLHNNRLSQMYYTENGNSWMVALPVISTQVPEEVVTAAITVYGSSLYDITKMKAADNTDVYQVRLLENNIPRSIWMNESGTVVTDVYKVKLDEGSIKIKSDEEKMKVKVENQ